MDATCIYLTNVEYLGRPYLAPGLTLRPPRLNAEYLPTVLDQHRLHVLMNATCSLDGLHNEGFLDPEFH